MLAQRAIVPPLKQVVTSHKWRPVANVCPIAHTRTHNGVWPTEHNNDCSWRSLRLIRPAEWGLNCENSETLLRAKTLRERGKFRRAQRSVTAKNGPAKSKIGLARARQANFDRLPAVSVAA